MSIYKKCNVCGCEKHISEFSAAYKNTCKECRNKKAREQRKCSKEIDWEQRKYEIAKDAIIQMMIIDISKTSHNFDIMAKDACEIANKLVNMLKQI